jgi:molybdate transport system substrate-binding protein
MKTASSELGFGRRQWLVSAAATVALVVGACKGRAPTPEANSNAPAAVPAVRRTLTVFAAVSLREAFTAIAVEHQRRAPNVVVTFNFAGTQELRAQVEQGAKADVFAAADTKHAGELEHQGLIGATKIFAENEPVVVVAKDASTAISSFAQLPEANRVVLGAPEVPIGRYSIQILENASKTLGSEFGGKVRAKVVSKELNVKQVLAKVALGEADAGIVYRTDVTREAQSKVVVLTIPTEVNVVARYPVAILTKSENGTDAQAWVDTVTSEAGRAILLGVGFKLPSPANSSP